MQVFGEDGCQFLPCQELQSPGEVGVMDSGENGVPGFDEVVAASVAEDAEGCVGREGGEDVADELVALDDSA